MTGPAERQVLAKQGVTGSYTVAPLTTPYGNEPIVQITAQGPSAAAATKSAALVGKAFKSQLANIQASQGTSKRYWIGSLELSRPDRAEQQSSSKLRDLIAVIAIGVILLFVVVSTMNAREERKRQRLSAQAGVEEAEPGPVRVAEPELNGHPVDSYAAESERARAVRFVRPAPEPGDGWLEFEEELEAEPPVIPQLAAETGTDTAPSLARGLRLACTRIPRARSSRRSGRCRSEGRRSGDPGLGARACAGRATRRHGRCREALRLEP